MVLIGVDPHKATHTAVVVDDDEHELARIKVKADRQQVAALLKFVDEYRPRRWAVESAGGLGFLLAQQLVRAGEDVVGVPGDAGCAGAVAGVWSWVQERSQRCVVDRDRGAAGPASAHGAGGGPCDGAAAAGRPPPGPDQLAHPGGLPVACVDRCVGPRWGATANLRW